MLPEEGIPTVKTEKSLIFTDLVRFMCCVDDDVVRIRNFKLKKSTKKPGNSETGGSPSSGIWKEENCSTHSEVKEDIPYENITVSKKEIKRAAKRQIRENKHKEEKGNESNDNTKSVDVASVILNIGKQEPKVDNTEPSKNITTKCKLKANYFEENNEIVVDSKLERKKQNKDAIIQKQETTEKYVSRLRTNTAERVRTDPPNLTNVDCKRSNREKENEQVSRIKYDEIRSSSENKKSQFIAFDGLRYEAAVVYKEHQKDYDNICSPSEGKGLKCQEHTTYKKQTKTKRKCNKINVQGERVQKNIDTLYENNLPSNQKQRQQKEQKFNFTNNYFVARYASDEEHEKSTSQSRKFINPLQETVNIMENGIFYRGISVDKSYIKSTDSLNLRESVEDSLQSSSVKVRQSASKNSRFSFQCINSQPDCCQPIMCMITPNYKVRDESQKMKILTQRSNSSSKTLYNEDGKRKQNNTENSRSQFSVWTIDASDVIPRAETVKLMKKFNIKAPSSSYYCQPYDREDEIKVVNDVQEINQEANPISTTLKNYHKTKRGTETENEAFMKREIKQKPKKHKQNRNQHDKLVEETIMQVSKCLQQFKEGQIKGTEKQEPRCACNKSERQHKTKKKIKENSDEDLERERTTFNSVVKSKINDNEKQKPCCSCNKLEKQNTTYNGDGDPTCVHEIKKNSVEELEHEKMNSILKDIGVKPSSTHLTVPNCKISRNPAKKDRNKLVKVGGGWSDINYYYERHAPIKRFEYNKPNDKRRSFLSFQSHYKCPPKVKHKLKVQTKVKTAHKKVTWN